MKAQKHQYCRRTQRFQSQRGSVVDETTQTSNHHLEKYDARGLFISKWQGLDQTKRCTFISNRSFDECTCLVLVYQALKLAIL